MSAKLGKKEGERKMVSVELPVWLWQRVKKQSRIDGIKVKALVANALLHETDRRRKVKA